MYDCANALTMVSSTGLMKSPLLIGADLQTIAPAFLELMKNVELIAVNQDEAAIQGTLRAAFPYANGDVRGGVPTVAAAAAIGRILDTAARVDKETADRPTASEGRAAALFTGITFCEFEPNITAHQMWLMESIGTESSSNNANQVHLVAVKQGTTCLVSTKHGGTVMMAPCDGSKQQSWISDGADITIAHIHPGDDVSLCLTTNGTNLETAACIAKPTNCSSDWNHHSSANGIDCTDSPRAGQLWYLNARGQLSSTYSNQSFFDFEDPYCLATSPGPRPMPPQLPPMVNHTLPRQVWAGPVAGGAIAVVLLNTGAENSSVTVTATWANLGLGEGVTVSVRDMWAHRNLDTASGSVSAVVGSHDAVALLLTPHNTE